MLDAIDFFRVMIRDFLLQMRKNTEVFYLYALKNSLLIGNFLMLWLLSDINKRL